MATTTIPSNLNGNSANQTNMLNASIGEYLTRLASQEGLYVGLGLGAVLGGLLVTRDIKTTLGSAFSVLALVERLVTELGEAASAGGLK